MFFSSYIQQTLQEKTLKRLKDFTISQKRTYEPKND